ncbi:MAG: 2-amino-4-hydroxy-6-hydroxymethyldihydropteridine diphosphokinase [Candidatus Aureabacteria bacterium]|nr:2-amino-4-hydroxy-6-hydroxymethyldihydropteridine diphosphokinase [Candidatus Auribacterota bacterium]
MKKEAEVYIGLGSNLGKKKSNIEKGIKFLQSGNKASVISQSSLYKTSPVCITSKKFFLNSVIKVKTVLKPLALLREIKKIEKNMGRKPSAKGDRVIDMDIILYGNKIIKGKALEIPHPSFHKRLFVLLPLCELNGRLKHPVYKKTIKYYIGKLKDSGQFAEKTV